MGGLELLGAEPAPRGLLINVNVRNTAALAAREGGATGAIAATLVPRTIEEVVLEKISQQLRTSLRERGVDAEVQIVQSTGRLPAKSSFGEGVAVGAGALGALWLLFRLFGSFL